MNAQNINKMPTFQYSPPTLAKPSAGDIASDIFLGTNNANNVAAQNNLLQQQVFNEQAMNAANAFNKYMWDQQAQYNTDKYNQTMAYNKYMAETQYQRAVQDMKKAGINPIVAFANGAQSNSVGNTSLGSVGGSASSSAQSGQGSTKGMNFFNGILGQATAKFVNAFTDKIVDKFSPEDKFIKIIDKIL